MSYQHLSQLLYDLLDDNNRYMMCYFAYATRGSPDVALAASISRTPSQHPDPAALMIDALRTNLSKGCKHGKVSFLSLCLARLELPVLGWFVNGLGSSLYYCFKRNGPDKALLIACRDIGPNGKIQSVR